MIGLVKKVIVIIGVVGLTSALPRRSGTFRSENSVTNLATEDKDNTAEKQMLFCPAVDIDIMCCGLGDESECSLNSDCQGSKICCAKDCILRCVDPVIPERPSIQEIIQQVLNLPSITS